MGIFRRNYPNDVLFLMPVRLSNEKLPKGKVRMLYCDDAGKVYATLINRSVYELAEDSAKSMEHSHKPFATLGLEASPGKFIPTAVEIGPKEVWALEHILEHALKNGRLPDILKRYIKPIIQLGEASREAALSEHKKRWRRVYSEATPRVLERLPYYSEHDIEISIPIYKAEHSYPLIVLKRLSSDEPASHNAQRLLILDSDGDLAIVKVPFKLIDEVEKAIKEHDKRNNTNVCALISKYPDGFAVNYMVISQLQKKALDTITRYFEKTGFGKQPISIAAKTVLDRARGKASSPAP
jgi:hypothetical protein